MTYRGRAIFVLLAPLVWPLGGAVSYFLLGIQSLGFAQLAYFVFVLPVLLFVGAAVTAAGLIFSLQLLRVGGTARRFGIAGLAVNAGAIAALAAVSLYLRYSPSPV